MEIVQGIEIIDLALYIRKHDVLVITDTQLGYEESLNRKGVMIPRFQFKDILKRLDGIFKRCKPKTVIINGDIKHEFGTITDTEWSNTLKLIDLLSKNSRLILVKGNHDAILEPIARKRDLEMVDHVVYDDIYFCHGHYIPDDADFKKANIVIIGHEHPALGLRDKGRSEKFKCFLKGKFKDKILIVQPSFNLVTEGTDVTSEKLLSPFIKNVGEFEAYVVANNIMYFGKVKEFFEKR